MALGKSTYQIVLETNLKSNNAFKNVNKKIDQINNKLKTLRNTLIAAFGVRELVRASDQFTNLNNKLAALTGSTELAAQGFDHIVEISRNARADLEATGDLFAKITFATQEMGLSLNDVAKATQTVANTFAIAGADTIATANASRHRNKCKIVNIRLGHTATKSNLKPNRKNKKQSKRENIAKNNHLFKLSSKRWLSIQQFLLNIIMNFIKSIF